MLLQSLSAWLSFGSLAIAGVVPRAEPPTRALVERQATSTTPVPDGECTNGPRTRQCWSNGYSINTDFDAKSPPDGTTVTYYLEISNTTMQNPDGSGGSKPVMLINGTYPGPTLRAKWGDWLVINVKNNLQHNGTGIHWHGIRQLNSCQDDGVPGVTECPIAPGKTRQYRFRATQFGTTWYHSHWSIQYGDGVVGALIIDGPASASYDEDLGALPLTDWYYKPAFELNEQAQHSLRGPPASQNILINGTHINAQGGGTYAKMTVKKGKKYRVRIINMSVDAYFSVSLDNHPFEVITSDFVPLKPYVADQVTLAVGQRYDVVFTANQTDDNYWFRVYPATACTNSEISSVTGITLGAIVHYEKAGDGNPPVRNGVTLRTACADETNLVPFVPNQVPQSVVGSAGRMNLGSFSDPTKNNLFRWTIDGSPMIVDFNDPTLETVLAGSTNFYNNSNVKSMQTSDWYLWWVQSGAGFGLPHPLHLHGHDFYIIGRGTGTWDGTTTNLNLNNPTRRDTATLPASGYLLMAFPADNPGMWIMHCHIAWHASQGLSMQFGERYSDLQGGSLGDTSTLKKGCDEWDKYWFPGNPEKPYNQTDSGI